MKEIALFVNTDIFGLEMINKICSRLLGENYRPVIFDSGTNRNIPFIINPPDDVLFYNVDLVRKVIIPFQETSEQEQNLSKIHADQSGQRYYSYSWLSKKLGIPYYQINDINSPEAFNIYRSHPDMRCALFLRGLQIAKKTLIEYFKERGFIWNIHGGLLPDQKGHYYRGLLIPAWAKINGAKTYGAALHHVGVGIDRGFVIDKVEFPLDYKATIFSLYRDLIDPSLDMIMDALRTEKRQHIIGSPQPEDGSYYPYPTQALIDKYGIVHCDPLEVLDYATTHYASTPQERHRLETDMMKHISLHEKEKFQRKIDKNQSLDI